MEVKDANMAVINGFAIGAHKISLLELKRQQQTPATIYYRVVPNWTIHYIVFGNGIIYHIYLHVSISIHRVWKWHRCDLVERKRLAIDSQKELTGGYLFRFSPSKQDHLTMDGALECC